MNLGQRVSLVGGLVVVLVAIGYSLLPFNVGDSSNDPTRCSAAMVSAWQSETLHQVTATVSGSVSIGSDGGAKVAQTPARSQPERTIHQAGPCQADGRHRLAVAGIVAGLGAVGALAAVLLMAERVTPSAIA